MARRTHVPKFGNWDANENLPYTAVFDHARAGRGRPINPNDPSQNPSMFPAEAGGPGQRAYNPGDVDDPLEVPEGQQERSGSQSGSGRGGGQPMPGSRDGSGSARGQYQQPSRRPPTGAQGNGRAPAGPGDPKRDGTGGFGPDQSPSHAAGRGQRVGAASPAWETRRKSTSSEDGQAFAPNTPNRSRLRPMGNNATREEPTGRGPAAALPKFGAWDAQDPQSGDGFTVIFNNARNEKKTGGPVNIPRTPDHKPDLYEPSSAAYSGKGHSRKKKWLCCLG